MSNGNILIIDDEPPIRKLLEITLESNDYKVSLATNGREGILMAANHPPDLILLDIGLPDKNGHLVLKELRSWYSRPIIILSVQNSEEDIVNALDNGANDYLTKPFRSNELLARVRSQLKASSGKLDTPVMDIGSHKLDFASRTLKHNGQVIKLTSTEFNLLALLAKNEDRVLTHGYLLQQIWGPGYVDETQYLRVFIAQLRKKIETDPNQPKHLITESGVGYRLVT